MPFHLFIHLVFSCVITTVPLLYFLIYAQRKYALGQHIRDLGPSSHYTKTGTPSIGGLALIVGQTLALLYCLPQWSLLLRYYTIALWGAGLLGLWDDACKIFKINAGINMRSKMIGLSIIFFIVQFGLGLPAAGTFLPFYGLISLPVLGLLLLHFLCFTGCSNAVNLTDGLDGLVSFVLLSFWCVLLLLCVHGTALVFSWAWPVSDLIILSWLNIISLGCFLIFNAPPASIFMGDTGALACGASIATVFISLQAPLLLLFFLCVPVLEALSVILQVGSVKIFKKRLFKMAPLHHHFELSGYSEKTVSMAFGCLNGVIALLSISVLWFFHRI